MKGNYSEYNYNSSEKDLKLFLIGFDFPSSGGQALAAALLITLRSQFTHICPSCTVLDIIVLFLPYSNINTIENLREVVEKRFKFKFQEIQKY